jgi:mannitol/fructose-specific phosphotransferase system IIA component (Ntr-type)
MSMSERHPIMQLVEKMSNEELVEMLRREYLRKLMRYRLTDEFFRKKYQMTYDEFEKENIVVKRDFSWEVESDAQEWEMAIDGISTCLRKLGEVRVEY